MKAIYYITALTLLALLPASALSQTSCTQELSDNTLGLHAVVESCENVGVFSIGGLHEGSWEKLTYFYPKPWPGTYTTFFADGKYYATSNHPKDGVLTDTYLSTQPEVSGGFISASWLLPEKISVLERLSVVENGTIIEVVLENKDSVAHKLGVRFHLDTMIGLNDGAPIYVPGDGLKTAEKEYAGSSLNFKYWKAYNRQDDPTIVATGYLDPDDGLTYPAKVVIADWKQSKDSAWDYAASPDKSILGDSAVILYYSIVDVPAGGVYSVKTKFGSGVPVLPKEKGAFGITEVTQDNVYGKYCPNEKVNISVDVISSRSEKKGSVSLQILKEGSIIYNQTKPTGLIKPDSYGKVVFTWTVPETETPADYDAVAVLFDSAGGKADTTVKKSFMKTNPKECPQAKKEKIIWLLIGSLLLLLLAAALLLLHLYGKGEVLITKAVNEKGLVKVTVTNKTRRALENCVISDGIPTQAEIRVSTLGTALRENTLIWDVRTLPAGQSATLEYRIKGVNVLPRAKVSWDGGEKISK
jgi:hypothetical protein